MSRKIEVYCELCGNEKTTAEDKIGDACRKLIEGPLARPYAFWKQCGEDTRRCCGGIGTEKDHIFFHSKYWDTSYPPKAAQDDPLQVGVEMGASFYVDCAATYYIRDFDSYTDSEEYGERIPYPAEVGDEAFWAKLDEQLDRAAEFAFNSDILTCLHCGYHYSEECSCEGSQEGENEEDKSDEKA